MMVSGMSSEDYEAAANPIVYGKLIDKLVEDFITRKDAEQMMLSSNLQVMTVVSGVAGAIPVSGTGQGTVLASFTGSTPCPAANIVKAKRKLEKDLGEEGAKGAIAALEAASK